MKKSFLSLFLVFLSTILLAQNRPVYQSSDLAGFDKLAAWKQAQLKSAKPAEQKEYFESLVRNYIRSKKQGTQVINATLPYSIQSSANKTIINLTPANAYCPNADFGNANFTNWVGGTYSNTSGLNWNTFTPAWTPGIVTMGNNTPTQPAVSWAAPIPKPNRHTIMTIPPTVNNPPANCIGWDSIAVNMSHLSDIPFVPPTAGGVTCRLGNANNDYETERLVYTMNVSLSNAQFTFAYAVVLYDGGHFVGEQPFFKVTMRDQSGNLISGCGQYQIDASAVATDTSFHRASQYGFGGTWTDGYITGTTPNPNWWYDVYYKMWTTVGVDLTAYVGQNVTIEFQTGDCIYGGHWGYAYIDASCGPTQALVNMCNGNTTQQILGPPGYISYQWYGPNSSTNAIASPNGTNDTLFITNGNVGDVYYLSAISANGCTTFLQAILAYSSVSILYTNSTPSCPGGTSGTANVVATGSPGTYNYAWTNSSGTNVGNTNPATGLAPGTYTVHVTAQNCGAHDTVVTVGISPPFTNTTTKNFCGSAAYLLVPVTGATNIQWYNASGIAIPGSTGTNDTLLVAGASNGQTYAVVYTQNGCVDSLRITLTQVAGGTLTHSNIQNVCIGGTNGQAVVTLNTTAPAPYNYTMTGPNYNQTYNAVSQTSFSLTGLAYGNYTVTAFDGTCFYADVFKIDTIPIPVYLTVAPKALCSNDSAYITYVFGVAAPTQCQLSSASCINATTHLVGPANTSNFSTSYPTPFGNWYTKMRAQYIYTVAELNAAGLSAGKLSSIAFNCTQINGALTYPNFNISLGCTNQTTFNMFPVQTDLIPGLSNVYSNANYNVTLGLNTFTFIQPYEWDGASNIVVEVCFEFPGQFNYTQNCVVDNTTSTNYPSLSIVSDTDPMCAGLTTTGSYYPQSAQMRPVATFGWCSSVATPNMYTYSLNPNVGVLNGAINPPNVTIIQPPTTTTYTFTTTSISGGCTKKDTFTISIVKPFNIHMPPAASFCSNTSASNIIATFTDVSSGAQTTIQSIWSGAGISANNGTGTATFNPATAGIGTHTLMLTAGGQCMAKDSVVFTVNLWQSGQISPIGPFCIYDAPMIIPHVANGGTWTGPVNTSGLFTPATAGVTSNLTPPYHFIKYIMNAGTPCPDSSSIQVQVFNKPLVTFTTDTTQGCEPSVGIMFISNVSPPGGTYHWVFGNGQTSTAPSSQNVYTFPGTYTPKLTYIDLNGCHDSLTKTGLIIVHAGPHANFYANPNHTTILEPHIYFTNTSTGNNNSWFWNIANFKTATTKNTDYEFADPGLYQITLYVTNPFNCKDSVTEYVRVDPDNVLYVPSAFTPNFDGKNDVFMAEAFGVFDTQGFQMLIFDRWGTKLFESGDIHKGWDGMKTGQVLQEDVYVYSISYKDSSGKMHTKTGQVSLVK